MIKKCIHVFVLSLILLGTVGCDVKEIGVNTVIYELEDSRDGLVLGQVIELKSKGDEVIYYKETASIQLENEDNFKLFLQSMEEMNSENSSRNMEGITYSTHSDATKKVINNIIEIDFEKADHAEGTKIIGSYAEEEGKISLEKVEDGLVKQGLERRVSFKFEGGDTNEYKI